MFHKFRYYSRTIEDVDLGWFTKREAGVAATVLSLTNNPCDVNIQAARTAFQALEDKIRDLEAGYSRLLSLDPERA